MCQYPIISNATDADIFGILTKLGSSIMGCVNGISVCSTARGSHCVLQTSKCTDPFRVSATRSSMEIEQGSIWP